MAVAESARSTVVTGLGGAASHNDSSSIITVGASDTFLLLAIECDTSTPGTPTAHWDSAGTNQAMTLIGTVTNSTATVQSLSLFGLVSPTTGAKLFSWTFPGQAVSVNSYHFGVSFTGTETSSVAAATTGFATGQGATGANSTVTSAASIPSGAMAVAAYNNNSGFTNAFTAGTDPGDGGTAVGKNESLTTNMAGEYYSGAGSTITATAANAASQPWVAAIVGILAPGGTVTVTSTSATLPMMGVG